MASDPAISEDLSERARIRAFDIVELAPIRGLHAPYFLAALLVYLMVANAFDRTGTGVTVARA